MDILPMGGSATLVAANLVPTIGTDVTGRIYLTCCGDKRTSKPQWLCLAGVSLSVTLPVLVPIGSASPSRITLHSGNVGVFGLFTWVL